MTEVTLTGLRVVLEVTRTGSFSAAAERLGYTQSAVSRQVAACERATGGPLFERQARGVRPTAAGEVLVRHAGRVLEHVAAATQELEGMHNRLAGRLVVGGYPTAMAHLIPRAVARLLTAHPGVQVQLIESSTPSQLTALRRGRLEVAVLATGQGLPDYDLDGLDLTEVRGGRGIGVAVAEGHPFASRSSVSVHDLTYEPWIVGASTNGSPEFGAWPDLHEPKIAFSVRGWPARFGLVSAGLGIALVPGSVAPVIPRGVCWVPVRTAVTSLGRATWAVTSTGPGPLAAAAVRSLVDEAHSWSPPPTA
jgi:DNA-binding transcriptional LysR family regulator